MTLKQLQIFAAVATHRNISKAARAIHVCQPTVSKHLKLLEDSTRVTFYKKGGDGIRLTPAGRLLHTALVPFLAQMENLQRLFNHTQVRRHQQGVSILAVGGSPDASVCILPKVFKTLARNHTNAHFLLHTGPSHTIEEMVLTGEVEIAVINSPSSNSRLTVEPLRPVEVVPVVSSKHPLAKKRFLTTRELEKTPVVLRLGGKIEAELQRLHLRLNALLRCDSLETTKAAVQEGVGVGFLSKDVVDLSVRQGHLKILEIPDVKTIRFHSFIIQLRDALLSEIARDFLAILRRKRF